MNNSDHNLSTSCPYLEIACGKTASPIRPIQCDRFLIGAGPQCDLRLGGDMPLVHSIVHLSSGTICIDPVADSPELLVNGRPGPAELQSGDEIVIGQFRMILHGADLAVAVQPAAAPAEEVLEAADEIDPSELSAAELVDLIEREEAMIEEFESGREAGAEALLDAVQRRAEANHDGSSEQTQELLGGIRSAVVSLGQSARQLEQPGRLTEQEVRQAASSLLDCQNEIITALDRVLAAIEQQKATAEPDEPQRHVA